MSYIFYMIMALLLDQHFKFILVNILEENRWGHDQYNKLFQFDNKESAKDEKKKEEKHSEIEEDTENQEDLLKTNNNAQENETKEREAQEDKSLVSHTFRIKDKYTKFDLLDRY